MRIIDFIIQTLLMMLAVVSVVLGLTAEKGYFFFTLAAQLFIGTWQLLSAFATAVNSNHGDERRTKMIRLYWLFVAIYFAVLVLLSLANIEMVFNVWFGCAWLIAIYYYVFTIRLAFQSRQRKTFLDVAN